MKNTAEERIQQYFTEDLVGLYLCDAHTLIANKLDEMAARLKEAKEVIQHYKEICGCGYGCHCKTAREYLDKWK